MKIKLVAVLVGLAMAGSFTQGALARTDGNSGRSGPKRAYQFHGTLASTDGDGDPATEGPFVVTVTKANGNGKRYLAENPGDVTISLDEDTRYFGGASSAADFAEGDPVKVKARLTDTGFIAKRVKLKTPDEAGA